MASQMLHNSLLRPAIIQIFRAAGFHSTRPAVLDTITDLAARYMIFLATSTVEFALNNHGDTVPDLYDVRLALQDAGAFRPNMSILEECWQGEEDMRGLEAFIQWFKGPVNNEILRIAGLVEAEGQAAGMESVEKEDYLTALKKKHSKTGEESRYQATVLGKSAEEQPVLIEGGKLDSIWEWSNHQTKTNEASLAVQTPSSGISSAPESVTELDDMDMGEER